MALHHMHPLIIAQCSATLHLPEGPFKRLVLMVNTFGYEGAYTVRGWAALGEDLAAAGVASLRYDLPDQGDSLDLAEQADAAAAWLRSVEDMVGWVRQNFPGVDICLCGFRLGALVATVAASKIGGLGGLVLLAPVLSGRNFVRELKLGLGPESGAMSEAAGLFQEGWWLSAASLATIGTWALKQLDPGSSAPMLVLADSGLRQLESWLGDPGDAPGLRGHQLQEAPDLLRLRADANSMRVPEASFATAVSWLRDLAGEGSGIDAATALHVVSREGQAVLTFAGGHERSIRLGEGGRNAGTWCLAENANADVPPVLMLNTGGNPRSGRSRLSARLARQFARDGISTLRIDIHGTGDAAPVLRVNNLALYGDTCIPDVSAAVEEMQREGLARPVLFGMCSGAYLGFQAALVERRISGLAMVNAQSFLWDAPPYDSEMSAKEAAQSPVIIKQLDRYHRIIFTANFWKRLLRGELRVRAVSAKVLGMWWQSVGGSIQRFLPAWAELVPRVGAVQRRFKALHQSGLPMLLVYSDTDPGLNELQACFGARGHRLVRQDTTDLHFVKGADHTFTATASAEELEHLTTGFLQNLRRSRP